MADLTYLDFLEERGLDLVLFEPFELGKTYYFRMAVYSLIGRVVSYSQSGSNGFVKLENASYVATDGRFGLFCAGELGDSETEFCGNWNLAVSAINDFGEWPHDLPTESR